MEGGKSARRTGSSGLVDARFAAGFTRHLKTKKLIRRIGYEGFFFLVDLILYARLNRPDGDLAGMTAEDIELAVEWKGEPGALVRGLKEVEYLDGEEGEYRLHDWADHQPWAVGTESRRDAARLAGLIRQYGEDRGREMFHADQARRSKKAATRSDNGSGSLDLGSEALAGRTAPSPFLTNTLPIHTAGAALPLPDWLPKEAWEGFEAMRKAIKKPLTDRARQMALNKLDEFRKAGHDPRRVLEQSEFNQWQDLYAPKDSGPRAPTNGATNGSPALAAFGEVRAAIGKGQKPASWTHPQTESAIEACGGWAKLKVAESRQLDFLQRDFVAAFGQAAH